ncbi:MAG: hypothetical protein AAF744_12180 [Pseudomonadota bacterium]
MAFLRTLATALLMLVPSWATAQVNNPAGSWRCIVNSEVVTIDVQMVVAPNQQLQFQGSILYLHTGRAFNVWGPGRWLLSPPDQAYPAGLFRFQMQPSGGNHAIFSMFAAPTGDPRFLGNQFFNPQTGTTTNTRCQRLG